MPAGARAALPRSHGFASSSTDPVGFDRPIWAQGGELGWYAMLVPENYGGGSVSGETAWST